MADTTKSIKNATDGELNEIVNRVRRERQALWLLRDLKNRSTPNHEGPYPAYSNLESFSTETPVSNGKSLKEMTNQELDIFLRRLENENELVNIIQDIKTMNKPPDNSDDGYSNRPYEGIDLKTPVKDLYHYGILGMKWGIRRKRGADGRVSSSDYISSRQLKKKRARELSNAELKELTTRMNLEQQLRSLKSSDQQKGLDFVKTITAVGTTITALYGLSQTKLGKQVADNISGAVKKAVTLGEQRWL